MCGAMSVPIHEMFSFLLQQSNRTVAVRALECLVSHSPDSQQVLTALRCLIRLRLTFLADNIDKRQVFVGQGTT